MEEVLLFILKEYGILAAFIVLLIFALRHQQKKSEEKDLRIEAKLEQKDKEIEVRLEAKDKRIEEKLEAKDKLTREEQQRNSALVQKLLDEQRDKDKQTIAALKGIEQTMILSSYMLKETVDGVNSLRQNKGNK